MSWFGFHTHHATWELRVMRGLFAVLIWEGLARPPVAASPHPHGVSELIDITFLADPRTFAILKTFLVIPLALFVWGRWMAPSLTYILALWVGSWTMVQSQGSLSHFSNVVGLVLLALWLGYTVGPILWRRTAQGRWPELTLDDLAMYWVYQMIAAAYVLAGVSKLTHSGIQLAPLFPRWVIDVQYIPVYVTTTFEQAYYGSLDPGVLERSQQLVTFFAAHPDLTRVFFSGGLVVELLAFLLLINRAWAAAVGASLFVMHVLINLTMNIDFYMNRYVLLIFLVNVPYWIVVGVRAVRRRGPVSRGLAALPTES